MSHDENRQLRPHHSDSASLADLSPDREDVNALVSLISQQQYVAAETLARRLIADFPDHGFAWKALGASLKPRGRMEEAIVAQHQAAVLLPNDASAHYNLGNSLLALGRVDDAAESYRRAVAIKPDYFEAHFHLGNALVTLNRLSEGVDSYQRALAIRADFTDAHANLGFTLLAIERVKEAEIHFQHVLLARPNDARVHNSLGIVYRGQGRSVEAEVCYRHALAITPDYAEAHSNLGNALRDQGRMAEAEASYRQALTINGMFIESHFNLANILHDQNRLLDAEQSYRRALEIKPDYFEAHNNLGNCLKKQGRLEEAHQCFETAIAIKPDFIEAHCNLSPLKTYEPTDAHLGLFEDQQHQIPALPVQARIRYWFALGKMRENVGRYDEAFTAYAEGNQLQHALIQPDEGREIALVERLQTVFSTAFFAARPKPTHSGKAPIFIVGMPRSGTTLIEQILSSHPSVYGAGELTDLDNVVHSIAAKTSGGAKSYLEIVNTLSASEFRRLGETYIERVWRLAPKAERITDKMMSNFLHVGMIHLMLPNAKIIHAMRDPMDSCFSCYSHLFTENNLEFTYDLGSVGRHYVRYIQLMQHWHHILPIGTVLDMHYENMVTDTEGQARRLLEYLDLPWDKRCLAFHQNKRVVRTASVAQVRRPIYRSSIARWKHFERQLELLLDIVKSYR